MQSFWGNKNVMELDNAKFSFFGLQDQGILYTTNSSFEDNGWKTLKIYRKNCM